MQHHSIWILASYVANISEEWISLFYYTHCLHPIQALVGVMKQFVSSAPNTAAMLLNIDDNKVMCVCQVPSVSTPLL